MVPSMRFNMSATDRGPPCSSVFTSPSVLSFSLITTETRATTSGDTRSSCAIRKVTSERNGIGRLASSDAACDARKMRKDQGDGLRMFARDEAAELVGVGLLQRFQILVYPAALGKMFRNTFGAFGSESVRQYPLGVFEAAAPSAGSRQLAEFFQDGLGLAGRHFIQARNRLADGLYFFVVQLLHQLGADLVSESDKQDGGLL